jgi:alpha-tubulin suppressor-like RCC1 family protein
MYKSLHTNAASLAAKEDLMEMKQLRKKLLSCLLAAAMIVGCLPFNAVTALAAPPAAGARYNKIATSGEISLAIDKNGDVWAWGYNGGYEPGDWNDNLGVPGNLSVTSKFAEVVKTPEKVIGISDVKSVATFRYASFAIKNDDSLWVWGRSGNGVGDGDADENKILPTPTKIMDDVLEVEVGYDEAFVLKKDGTVLSWGYDGGNGELGRGQLADDYYMTPTAIPGLTDVVDVATGYNHTFALKSDGTVVGWGMNGETRKLLLQPAGPLDEMPPYAI